VAAKSENDVIGKNGDIPWHYPEDMEHFKQLTIESPVVMGRKTYESIPKDYRPLPGRKNIVLTRSDPDLEEGVEKANSLDEAWELAEQDSEKVYIIGGSKIYQQTLDLADEMVITEIDEKVEGDTYFPEIEESSWKEKSRDNRDDLSFVRYQRT